MSEIFKLGNPVNPVCDFKSLSSPASSFDAWLLPADFFNARNDSLLNVAMQHEKTDDGRG